MNDDLTDAEISEAARVFASMLPGVVPPPTADTLSLFYAPAMRRALNRIKRDWWNYGVTSADGVAEQVKRVGKDRVRIHANGTMWVYEMSCVNQGPYGPLTDIYGNLKPSAPATPVDMPVSHDRIEGGSTGPMEPKP